MRKVNPQMVNTAQPRPYTPAQQLWPATSRGVHRARRDLAERLAEWELTPDVIDSASLVLAELMANAARHGRVHDRQIGVSAIRVEGGVLVEVHDARDEQPRRVQAGALDEQGRGLTLVEALTCGNWGVSEREGPGKVVWAMCIGVPELLTVNGG